MARNLIAKHGWMTSAEQLEAVATWNSNNASWVAARTHDPAVVAGMLDRFNTRRNIGALRSEATSADDVNDFLTRACGTRVVGNTALVNHLIAALEHHHVATSVADNIIAKCGVTWQSLLANNALLARHRLSRIVHHNPELLDRFADDPAVDAVLCQRRDAWQRWPERCRRGADSTSRRWSVRYLKALQELNDNDYSTPANPRDLHPAVAAEHERQQPGSLWAQLITGVDRDAFNRKQQCGLSEMTLKGWYDIAIRSAATAVDAGELDSWDDVTTFTRFLPARERLVASHIDARFVTAHHDPYVRDKTPELIALFDALRNADEQHWAAVLILADSWSLDVNAFVEVAAALR